MSLGNGLALFDTLRKAARVVWLYFVTTVQHIDRDLKPYICLFEECSDGHSAYPTFNEWCRHMKLHDSRWHQKIYLTPNWVCPLCAVSENVYNSPQALYLHLTGSHALEIDGEDLNDDFKSNSVDIDEENTRSFISKDTDLGRSSHQSSLRDVTMEDIDGEKAMRPCKTQTAPTSQQGGSPSQLDRSTAVPSRLSNIAPRPPQPALGSNTPPPVLPVIQLQADATASNSQPPSQLALENKSDTGDEGTFSPDISGTLMATKTASLSPPEGDAILNDKVDFARSTKDSTTVPDGFGTNAISPKSPRRANLGKSLTLAPWQDDSAVQDGFDPKPEPESASPSGERPKTYPLTKFPGYDFFEAIDKGDIPTIERLLENGADLEVADEFGRTPLWRAPEARDMIQDDKPRVSARWTNPITEAFDKMVNSLSLNYFLEELI
ncbi:hypothetical protein TRIATDRAFT_285954 [Trichoderma atroviride IMI 206040]|uniref:Uncharacterized protein n=1 Tax=Hypocrea atroviridis (strain ATCC 20476 / IMI 206040) TaxID=452589 RepID=G9P1K7_HYPAI|nr:uncharacterized protein TRIATDRAFT_285954 [Trichoderma atroviride IMI 206040]EHK43341.1 hypothetical protein TRIATDRAFT_285954 [Trichoderma atroviride IMI 206040]